MSFDVGIIGSFVAHHSLVGDFGPASRDHAHTYRVEVTVSGQALGDDGTLFDITLLQRGLDAMMATLNRQDLNTIPEIATPNPTAEVVARHVFRGIAASLREDEAQPRPELTRLSVRVWESADAFAGYADDLT